MRRDMEPGRRAADTEATPEASRPARGARAFHIPALDGVRAIAFLLVFVAHAGLGNLIPGGLGVTVFFFLSGYLITTLLRIEAESSGTISLRRFYVRRARRIFPPMYITLAVACALAAAGIVVAGTLQGALSSLFYFYNYLELTGAPDLLPAGLGVVWSLMIEEHFYFVFPFVYRRLAGRRRETQAGILAAVCLVPLVWRCVLVFALHSEVVELPRWTYSATDTRFDSILWGCVLAIGCNPWFNDRAGILGRHRGKLAVLGLATLLATIVIRNPYFRETFRYSLQGLALFPIFFYCVGTRDRWTSWLELGALKEIGRLSYTMYLIHLLVLVALARAFHWGNLATSACGFALTFAYAELMRLLVEDPLRRLIR